MSKRLFYCSLIVVLTLLTFGNVAAQDGFVLHVFGPTSLDNLGSMAPDEIQAQVEQEVIDGFLAENPDVF